MSEAIITHDVVTDEKFAVAENAPAFTNVDQSNQQHWKQALAAMMIQGELQHGHILHSSCRALCQWLNWLSYVCCH